MKVLTEVSFILRLFCMKSLIDCFCRCLTQTCMNDIAGIIKSHDQRVKSIREQKMFVIANIFFSFQQNVTIKSQRKNICAKVCSGISEVTSLRANSFKLVQYTFTMRFIIFICLIIFNCVKLEHFSINFNFNLNSKLIFPSILFF